MEACHIGVEYFHILAHTKLLIEESYHAVAYTAPPLVQPASCTMPLRCEASWKDEWWNGVARQLLHPEDPCHSNKILALLGTAEVPGVCVACKEAVTSKIMQSDALQQEETLGNITMLEVMELQTDKHFRASFRQLNSC
ncbi:hypothetical protein JVT61DRAFT_10987 [Boletus reticuloceps]|uniref:Uncharacterized protein n=1 Tax=Boletus reticuloceps TaxID=495285 RepID=A0A8I2YFR4_9AGAM|nr:hypothetical protein JVT61DRAFT_10987 [Boletus reticuloceps]